jgi:hypothetical protein
LRRSVVLRRPRKPLLRRRSGPLVMVGRCIECVPALYWRRRAIRCRRRGRVHCRRMRMSILMAPSFILRESIGWVYMRYFTARRSRNTARWRCCVRPVLDPGPSRASRHSRAPRPVRNTVPIWFQVHICRLHWNWHRSRRGVAVAQSPGFDRPGGHGFLPCGLQLGSEGPVHRIGTFCY